jgi:hypothetical protein
MAEDEDLEVLGSVVLALLATADEETDEGACDKIDERPHRPIVAVVIRARIGVSDPHGDPLVSVARHLDGSVDPVDYAISLSFGSGETNSECNLLSRGKGTVGFHSEHSRVAGDLGEPPAVPLKSLR